MPRSRTRDPLAGVRIKAPEAEPEKKLAKSKDKEPVAVERPTDVLKKNALRDEKKVVVPPPKELPVKPPEYVVAAEFAKRVSWKGQLLRLVVGKTVISDSKFGPGAVDKFQRMGVQLKLKE